MNESRLLDYLDHMQQAAANACSFVEGLDQDYFLNDKRTQQAVIMSLIIIGEAATKVMDSLLWLLYSLSVIRTVSPHKHDPGEMGKAKVQAVPSAQDQSNVVSGEDCGSISKLVRSLASGNDRCV